jgi:hypothetical protein
MTANENDSILIITSKVKSPSEKKRISLVKDRRNVYGECPTSSRKNIRLGKQRGHMEVRRAAATSRRARDGSQIAIASDNKRLHYLRILLQDLRFFLRANIIEPGFVPITDALRFNATLQSALNSQVFKKSSDAFEHELPVVIFQGFHARPKCRFLENSARSPHKFPVAFGIDNQVKNLLWRWY